MDIKAKCRNCGRQAKPEEFVLDPYYKMMVCPLCVKERKTKTKIQKELEEKKTQEKEQHKEEKKLPPGYDKDDTYLEKAYAAKMKDTVKVDKIGQDKVRYTCPKCNYTFEYDILRKIPGRCPYCSSDIRRMRF